MSVLPPFLTRLCSLAFDTDRPPRRRRQMTVLEDPSGHTYAQVDRGMPVALEGPRLGRPGLPASAIGHVEVPRPTPAQQQAASAARMLEDPPVAFRSSRGAVDAILAAPIDAGGGVDDGPPLGRDPEVRVSIDAVLRAAGECEPTVRLDWPSRGVSDHEPPRAPGPNLWKIWRAGFVRRWHANPVRALRESEDTNWGHSGRAAALADLLWPTEHAPVRELLRHDLGESLVGGGPGDASGRAKTDSPELADALDLAEAAALGRLGLEARTRHPDARVRDQVKLCDLVDAYLMMLDVAPECRSRDGWPLHRARALELADELLVGAQIRQLLEDPLREPYPDPQP